MNRLNVYLGLSLKLTLKVVILEIMGILVFKKIVEMINTILQLGSGKLKAVKEVEVSETMRMETHIFQEAVGLWEGRTGLIIIKRDLLKNIKKYAGMLLYEVARAQSGASDISSEFKHKLTQIIGTLISSTI